MSGFLCAMVGATFATVSVSAEVLRKKQSVIAIANAQIDTAQSKFGGSSAYFDGVGDRLQVATNDGIYFTGDFTIEMWMRSGNETGMIFGNVATNVSPNAGQVICYYSPGSTRLEIYFNGQSALLTNTTINVNTWYHIAMVRSGSTVKVYVDGTEQSSTKTVTGDIGTATYPTWYLAGLTNDADCMLGHLDEIRFSKTARYTAAFTAPTAPFANDDNTLLLIHANGTDGTTFFEDDNGATTIRTARTLTANGNAQLDTAQYKFGQSSMLFDGTGDYFSSPAGNQWDFGTGSFTIEYWIRFNVAPTLYVPIALRTSGSINNGEWWCEITNAEKKMYWGFKNYAGTQYYVNLALAGTAFTTGQWYHIALVNNAGTAQMYVDGTATGSTTALSGSFGISTTDLWIGAGAGSYSLNGWMDEVRISKVARYTANFTAPTGPFDNDANTLLLVHANGADAALTVTDDNSGRSPHGLFQQNTAAISTTQSKFGGSSLSLNGSSSVNTPTAFAFGTGDFTVEYWVRPTTLSGYDIHWDLRGSNTSQVSPIVYTNGTTLYMDVGATNRITGSTLSTATWYHIALSRASGSTKLFVNGTQVGSTYTDTNSYLAATPLYIGMSQSGSGVDGYMDEFRISNSARYTANFTAPTTPFVNDANTLLLCHFDGTNASTVFRDDNGIQGAAPKTLAASGNAQLSTAQYKFGTSSLLMDGNGDYLTVTNAHDLNFQKNDFTIEAWVRFDALATSNRHTLISNGVSSFTTGWIKFSAADLGAAYYPTVTSYDYSSGGSPILQSSTAVSNNTWYHLAWVRRGLNHYLYLDGVEVASNSNSTAQGINVNMNLSGTQIGRYSFDNGTPPSATYMDGYIDEMRISNVARYTAAFTPSTTAFTKDPNTLFLSHFEGANASTTMLDDGGRQQKGISAVGTAQIDTAQSKFGGSSALISTNNNGNYLSSSQQVRDDLNLTGDFTIEFWCRLNSNSGAFNTVMGSWAGGGSVESFYIATNAYNATGKLGISFWDTNGSKSEPNFGSALSTGVWFHAAFVRSGTTLYVFKDGTLLNAGGTTMTYGIRQTGTNFWIGSNGSSDIFDGWLDEIRISNTARYTANFTPSTTPFQNDDNTLLLLHMDGTDASTAFFDDNGAKPYTP